MTTPEGKVKDAVKKVLKAASATTDGWWPVPGGYGENWLDYQGCNAGRFLAVETKAPGKKTSDRQDQVIARIKRVGGEVFVIDSVDSPELQRLKDWLIT